MKLTTKNLTNSLLKGAMAYAFALDGGNTSAQAADGPATPDAITAIDILLLPDATMLQHAQATNDRLLKVYPKGFPLDASHHPHVTMVQRFVRTADLDELYVALDKIFTTGNVTGLKLEAFKYYYLPDKDLGLSGIVVKPTPELLKLEQQVIDAVTPFTVPTGTSAAFFTTPDDPIIQPLLIEYVSTFVPKASGEHYHPHVTTGIASREYLDKMLKEPFGSFTFSPVGAAVYQLGQFGTAAKKLKEWDLKAGFPLPAVHSATLGFGLGQVGAGADLFHRRPAQIVLQLRMASQHHRKHAAAVPDHLN